jgi:hypothetical protein
MRRLGLSGLVPLSGNDARQFAQRVANGLLDQRLFRLRRSAQNIIQHLAAVAGMADAEPQARENRYHPVGRSDRAGRCDHHGRRPAFSRTVPGGRSRSSWTTRISGSGIR